MAQIVLSTLNAKFIHSALGLRYLLANLGPLAPDTVLLEFEIRQHPIAILERILAHDPKIVGFGVYIWNVIQTTELVSALKQVRPNLMIILGGPEVSYPPDQPEVVEYADYVITGEADLKFAEVCQQLLAGTQLPSKIIPAELPALNLLALPYRLYTDQDLAHRVVYIEASRGCPFTCEFCLSSLDVPVRAFPLDLLLDELQSLFDRGARHFKFVDRTFNLNIAISQAILEFFLRRHTPGCFFHFEMVPDRLPDSLRQIISRFPPGSLQFEVGIQTFNEEVSHRIKRRQNYQKLSDNLHFLRNQTGVYIHADLIVGLPGESWESFAAGFDRLIHLSPQEIQIGLLKRLRGTPITRHDTEWGMVYNPNPPYEVLQNNLIDFQAMQRLRRFARFWDLIGNSGNFIESAPLIWVDQSSPFAAFLFCAERLFEQIGRTDSIALDRLVELLLHFLQNRGVPPEVLGQALVRDYLRNGRKNLPAVLQPYQGERPLLSSPSRARTPKRQARRSGTGSLR